MVRRRVWLSLGMSAALLSLSGCDKLPGLSAGNGKPSVPFNAVDITGADYGRKLSLPDLDGKTRTMADFKGKVTVVFFGFTQCPEVCPTTMAELAQVKKSLGADGDRVQGVFVTIDPERDTPAVLKGYLSSFDPSFVALRGNLDQTAEAAKDFKVFYAKVPGKSPGEYTMEHTAGSYVFDASGKLRLFTRYVPGGAGATALTADLKQLLTQG